MLKSMFYLSLFVLSNGFNVRRSRGKTTIIYIFSLRTSNFKIQHAPSLTRPSFLNVQWFHSHELIYHNSEKVARIAITIRKSTDLSCLPEWFSSTKSSTLEINRKPFAQKTEKTEKTEAKKTKVRKASKDKDYELPEIPDYERPVLEKPQEFEFGEYAPRDKTKLDRPTTQVRETLLSFFILLR